jgi:hypothetical protein
MRATAKSAADPARFSASSIFTRAASRPRANACRSPAAQFTIAAAPRVASRSPKEFDDWSAEAFLAHIYNSSYIHVDPDYASARPVSNASAIAETLRAARDSIAILDFGGGNGAFASHLVAQGFSATTYDPFSGFKERPSRRFDVITCFEVMEHTPFPARTAAEMCDMLADEGIILFSTLTQPADFDQQRLHWWYAGPRNGHVSLYSRESLTILFQQLGLQLFSISELVHVAFRKLPAFA